MACKRSGYDEAASKAPDAASVQVPSIEPGCYYASGCTDGMLGVSGGGEVFPREAPTLGRAPAHVATVGRAAAGQQL